MFNRKYLFDLLRNAPFGGTLSTAQVKGVGGILDYCEKLSIPLPLHFIAYILATAFHETGGKFGVSTESLNYSADALKSKFSRERISIADADKYGRKGNRPANQRAIGNLIYGGAWGKKNLGNTQPNDGYDLRGRGFAHLTGRRGYGLFGLLGFPERAAEFDTAIHVLVHGMVNGIFTGKRLSDYYLVNDDKFDAKGARAIVNGTDKASLIASHYESIYAALKKAYVPYGATNAERKEAASMEAVEPDDVKPSESGIVKSIYGTLGAGTVTGVIAAVANPWAAGVVVALLVVGSVFLWGHLTGRIDFKRIKVDK